MRAIVVDDEKLALDSLCAKLSRTERISEVHAFSSSEAALAYFTENGADIVFPDIQMPRMDGLTLASRMREIKPSLTVIFITGYAEYSLDAFRLHADGYLLKPVSEADIERELDALEQLRRKASSAARIRVQCFGDFEIFADDIPVPFSRAKSRELLAYLVDRRGAKCSAAQIAAALWEDGVYNRSRQKQFGVIRAEMLKSLRQVSAEGIIYSSRDALAVLPRTFDCDYYSALDGDRTALAAFSGEYMSTYSWAEVTAASLGERRF